MAADTQDSLGKKNTGMGVKSSGFSLSDTQMGQELSGFDYWSHSNDFQMCSAGS